MSNTKKSSKGAVRLLAAVLLVQLLLSFFIPWGVAMNMRDAMVAPTGLPHIIGYKIEELFGSHRPFNPYDPSMEAVNGEWLVRHLVNEGDVDRPTWGDVAYEDYVQEVQANCWVFLLIWIFLAAELILIRKQREKEKADGEKRRTSLLLIAAMLTPFLWAECIYLLTGTLHPMASFLIAFVLFMSIFYSEKNRTRRKAKVPPLAAKYCRKCGAQLIENSRYCSYCGASVEPETSKEEK